MDNDQCLSGHYPLSTIRYPLVCGPCHIRSLRPRICWNGLACGACETPATISVGFTAFSATFIRLFPRHSLHLISADLAKLRHRRHEQTTPPPPTKNSVRSISLRRHRTLQLADRQLKGSVFERVTPIIQSRRSPYVGSRDGAVADGAPVGSREAFGGSQ